MIQGALLNKVGYLSPLFYYNPKEVIRLTAKIVEAVWKIIEPVADREGLELVDIEYRREDRGWVLRIYIDRENGVNVGDCSRMSGEIGTVLDVEDPIPQSYHLEVSSPGLNRPLKKEGDYQKYQGKLVKIRTVIPIDGRQSFTGRLLGYSDGQVRVEVEGKEWEIPFDQIIKANLQYEF
ncbi:MAG: ribosome maturation factor RimP [Deltaproteobacteria bacterium]|nr:MAG: ribosome maturation factor RimP [Deltaproteobacteria bacterium]